jgi:hypothetical protein
VEELALHFAGDAADPVTMEQARVAAHAHIELTKLTAASIACIERAYRLGFTAPADYYSAHDFRGILQSPNWQELLFPVSTMPPAGPERLGHSPGTPRAGQIATVSRSSHRAP